MEHSGRGRDLRQYIRIVQQRWKLVVAIAIVGITVGTVYVLSLPRIYEASSLVVLQQPQAPSVLDRIPGIAPQVPQGMTVQTASALVRSNLVASLVARRLNSKRLKSPQRQGLSEPFTTRDVLKSLTTEGIQPDQVFIHAHSTDRERSVLMANETANVFIELRDRETRDNSQGRYKILVRKLDEVDREARRVDEKIAAFLREAMVFGPEAVQEQIKALAELKRGRDEAAAATEAAEQSAQDLQKQLKTEGKMQYVKLRQVDPSLQSLQEKADELEIQYIKAQAEYQPSADELESLKEQLETARQQVEQARRKRFVEVTQAAPNPEYQELLKASLEAQARTALSRARSQRFNQAYDEEMRALSKLPGQFQKLSDLRRQAEEFARLRGLLLSKKLDAEIEMNTLQKKAAIGDRALTGKAVAPRKPQLVIAVIVLSLAVGIGAALASHWTDVTVNAPEEMERVTGVPSLGFIPDMGRRDGAQQLVAHHSPRSPVSEAYRTLRSTLRYATMDKPIRTLIVTSAAAGEGKTVTAANLAVSIADTGQRVMVVDADLRRPSQHGLFEKERTVGLTSVLVGDLELSAALLRTDVENLTLLPAGPTPPNPSELLESAAMTETLEQLAAMCDLVIIDVPPVLAVTDACALTSKVDAVLLVVRAGKTPSDVTAQAVGTLQRARGSVVGAVLNGVKVTRNSLYHYYYAYADGTRRQRVSQRGR